MADQLIQAPPKGLLYLLGQKTGINPSLLPEHVQPTIDLFQFYGTNYLKSTLAGTALAAGGSTSSGPAPGFAFYHKNIGMRFQIPAGLTSFSWELKYKSSQGSTAAVIGGGEYGPPTVLTAATWLAVKVGHYSEPLPVLAGGYLQITLNDIQGAANMTCQVHTVYYEFRTS